MSIAKYTTTYDGHTYEVGEEIPDLGSMVATNVEGNIREYKGLSKDFDKLKQVSQSKKYDDLETNSSAYLVDTVEYYKYEKTSREWYKQ